VRKLFIAALAAAVVAIGSSDVQASSSTPTGGSTNSEINTTKVPETGTLLLLGTGLTLLAMRLRARSRKL
jgi:hypothetical protein